MNITIKDIIKAKKFLSNYNISTPLRYNAELSNETGGEIYIKHENMNLSGAFKIRGGLYFIGTLSPEERNNGIIAVTRGNHGIGLSIAGKLFNTQVTVVVPFNNSVSKNRTIRGYGADLIEHGKDYNEAKEYCEELLRDKKMIYAHTANEPIIISAAGTCPLEIFEEIPDLDYLIVPIGGGGLITGSIIVRDAINPNTKIIGVQPEHANATYLSWKRSKLVSIESADTIADGLATRTAFELPFSYIKNGVFEIFTVTEREIMNSIWEGIEFTHSLIEGASATTIAILKKISHIIRGKKVALIITGSNIDKDLLFRTIPVKEVG